MPSSKKFHPDPTKKSLVKHKTRSGFGLQGRNPNKFKNAFKVGPKNAADGTYLGKAKRIKADLITKAKIKKHYYRSIGQDKSSSKRKSLEKDPFFQSQDSQDEDEDGDGHGDQDEEMKDTRDDDDDDDDDDEEEERANERRNNSHENGSMGKRKGKERARETGSEEGENLYSTLQRRDYGKFGPVNDSDQFELLNSTPKNERKRRKRLEKQKEKEKQKQNPTTKSSSSSSGGVQASNPISPSLINQDQKKKPARSREESLKIREERFQKWNSVSKSYKGRERGQPNLGNRMEVLLDKIKERA